MLFNSYIFIFLFLPITLIIYYDLNRMKVTIVSRLFLVFASLFFYSWWNIAYLPVILFSIFFNYTVSLYLVKKENVLKIDRKSILIFGIVINVLLLAYFKYSDFFIENINLITHESIPLLHLALPLAISFFTFQQIAYLVDSYRGKIEEYGFLNYANFVTFFPQLIAGPIVHHSKIMSQFANCNNKRVIYKNIIGGIFIFSLGLFKKVVIADSFAVWATEGFDTAQTLNLLEAWITSLSYTFQLYFDFSGYTDMAIGTALLFNIKLPINFNSPYKARSIQDFWRRWHITLSNFLRDYIYIPLGGNRRGHLNTYANIMATFIIGGIWHGAGWTFIFWGFLHGLALVIENIWRKLGFKLNSFLAWFVTFNFINITWVFFRAKEWDDAIRVLKAMFTIDNMVLPAGLADKLSFLTNYGIGFGMWLEDINANTWTIIYIFMAFIIVSFYKNSNEQLAELQLNYKTLFLSSIAFSVGVLYLTKVSEFLYFNF